MISNLLSFIPSALAHHEGASTPPTAIESVPEDLTALWILLGVGGVLLLIILYFTFRSDS